MIKKFFNLKTLMLSAAALTAGLYPVMTDPTAAFSDSEFIVLWLLAGGIVVNALREFRQSPASKTAQAIGWGLLFIAVTLLWSGISTGHKPLLLFRFSLLSLLLGITAWNGGLRFMLKTMLPFTIFIIVLPFLNYFHYLLSYPLCVICAWLTASTLGICGMNVSNEAAVLIVSGSERISITTACSGIFQLEAMLLIGWILVVSLHRSQIRRAAHFIMIFPIVVLTNTMRLVTVIILYVNIGESAFNNTLHVLLGVAMIVAATVLLWECRRLFQQDKKNES